MNWYAMSSFKSTTPWLSHSTNDHEHLVFLIECFFNKSMWPAKKSLKQKWNDFIKILLVIELYILGYFSISHCLV